LPSAQVPQAIRLTENNMRPERATYHHFTALDSSDNNRTRERGKGKEGRSVTVVECIEGVYEVQDVEFGKVYK
jgi:hypothetical protein